MVVPFLRVLFCKDQELCYTINKPVCDSGYSCVYFFVLAQTHHYLSVHTVGKFQVLEARLCREGVSVEPLQQREIKACASVAVLSCVDVGVHESWHQKLTGM